MTSTLRLSVCLRTQKNQDHKRPKPRRFISKIISLLLRVLDSVYDAENMLQIFLLSEFPVESCMLFTADYFTVFFSPIFIFIFPLYKRNVSNVFLSYP